MYCTPENVCTPEVYTIDISVYTGSIHMSVYTGAFTLERILVYTVILIFFDLSQVK